MIWRNANGRLSIEAYIVIAVATFIGSVAGANWIRYYDGPPTRAIVFDGLAEVNDAPHAKTQ